MDTDGDRSGLESRPGEVTQDITVEHTEPPEIPTIRDPTRKKREKDTTQLQRDPGKSLFPVARVQRILKADKELPMIARDAVFLISLATEEFVKRLSEEGQKAAERSQRTTVQQRDIATVVRRADEFVFLEEIISWAEPTAAPARRKPKALEEGPAGEGTMLDHFVKHPQTTANEDVQNQDDDVVLNEDGTMGMATED
ncbi:histone-fold-containing protein [Punctularia strigosozonata HHB-11173 SS5]|uniref:histone-fold-containing protein n=1 Tax=Punctularia strigosozonata (strain HHB-11173) TaxID=741275 RepID=UPI0004417F7E|nr:histone-fold-containing protein [Punctularia strigosozonata HHB-11173 SS5]EIN12889.1 histone-fold-containing protein [Punctularia strigosozonata HHB-11173 SS5]